MTCDHRANPRQEPSISFLDDGKTLRCYGCGREWTDALAETHDGHQDGLLPVRPRGKHEIEAAGGWVVACGAYGEYGCMPTEVRDYIIEVLNADPSPEGKGEPR